MLSDSTENDISKILFTNSTIDNDLNIFWWNYKCNVLYDIICFYSMTWGIFYFLTILLYPSFSLVEQTIRQYNNNKKTLLIPTKFPLKWIFEVMKYM